MYKQRLLILFLALLPFGAAAQVVTEKHASQIEGIVEFAEIVHDFGDVLISDGPLSCTFTLKNISDSPIVIYNVASSCGCTDVTWTKSPIEPGSSGKIEATYSNDEGPYRFDKTLSVYISSVKRPVILRLRGSVHKQPQSLADLYPLHFGPLAFKSANIKGGNMDSGSQRGDKITVANIGKVPLILDFENVSPGLKLKAAPSTIPAGSTGTIVYTITALEGLWGKNYFYFTPTVDGKAFKAVDAKGGEVSQIGIWTFTRENFSNLSEEEKGKGAVPVFKSSTYDFGKVAAGSVINAVFSFSNKGKSDFVVHKVEPDVDGVSADDIPIVSPGGKCSFKVSLDTTGLPKGDTMVVVSLITNSPSRPIVNLHLSGTIL